MLAAIAALYLLLALASLEKPVGSDEMVFLLTAKDLALTGIPWIWNGTVTMLHPPLYPHVLAFAYRVLGFHVWSAKLVGVVCALAVLALVARHLAACPIGRREAGAALALLALSPLFVQGSVLLDSDNTVLDLVLVAFVLGWIRLEMRPVVPGARWRFGLLFGAALWSKLTTPPLVAALVVLFAALRRRTALIARVLLPALAIGAVGFVVTFGLYCRWKGLAWSQPLDYLLASARGRVAWREARGAGLESVKNLVELVLWIQLPLAVLFGWAVAARVRRLVRERAWDAADLLWIVGGAIAAGYVLVGGTTFGFPRYSFPALAPICLVAATGVTALSPIDPRVWRGLVGVSALLAIGVALVVGDPLYTWRYAAREALIRGASPAGALLTLVGQLVVAAGLPLLVQALYLKRATGTAMLRVALLFAALSQSAALDLQQAFASYNTNYNYGETGTAAVVEAIARAGRPDRRVIATLEVTGRLAWEGRPTRGISPKLWSDPAALAREIRDPGTGYVAYSVSSNTVAQHRETLGDPRVQAALAAGFEPRRLGGYTLWRRTGR